MATILHYLDLKSRRRGCCSSFCKTALNWCLHVGAVGSWVQLSVFCPFWQQTNVPTHLASNMPLGATSMTGYGFLGMILVVPSGPKCPTCMKPSLAMTFISTCAFKKGSFRGPKSFFWYQLHLQWAHAVSEHTGRTALISSFHQYRFRFIWTSTGTTRLV